MRNAETIPGRGTAPAPSPERGCVPMNAHTILSVTAHGPREAGALSGWEAVCSCGFRTGNSLGERWASRQGWEHVEYMTRQAKATKKTRR
jgi:hypothetical protein